MILGTDQIPQVRDSVADFSAYAESLMAFVIVSVDTAREANGLLIPNERFVTPGRLYSVTELPVVMQVLRDLSGQDLQLRPRDEWVAGLEDFLDPIDA